MQMFYSTFHQQYTACRVTWGVECDKSYVTISETPQVDWRDWWGVTKSTFPFSRPRCLSDISDGVWQILHLYWLDLSARVTWVVGCDEAHSVMGHRCSPGRARWSWTERKRCNCSGSLARCKFCVARMTWCSVSLKLLFSCSQGPVVLSLPRWLERLLVKTTITWIQTTLRKLDSSRTYVILFF